MYKMFDILKTQNKLFTNELGLTLPICGQPSNKNMQRLGIFHENNT